MLIRHVTGNLYKRNGAVENLFIKVIYKYTNLDRKITIL